MTSFRCPNCKSSDSLYVLAEIVCRITDDDDLIPAGQPDIADGYHTVCDACEFEGANMLFQKENQHG